MTCAGAAVQGVVVTDGVNMTRTNKQGAYGLRTSSDKSKLVYLTVPSGYEVESTRGFIPRFYRRVTAPTSVEQMQRHDFTLKKVNNDRHIMIVSADMHIRNRAMIKTTSSATPSICPPKGELDSTTFRRTYLKALRDYVKALPAGVPVYGMNLGDMTQESHWTNANKATPANFVNVCERGGMPIQTFHAIGNHDHPRISRKTFKNSLFDLIQHDATSVTASADAKARNRWWPTSGPGQKPPQKCSTRCSKAKGRTRTGA